MVKLKEFLKLLKRAVYDPIPRAKPKPEEYQHLTNYGRKKYIMERNSNGFKGT